MRRVGIDVGGTNTDAVLVEYDRIVASVKTPTTPDVTSGITTALADILAASAVAPADLQAVMIGTTHFTNAVAQRRDLITVAAVRIFLPASASLEPFIDWPSDLREKVMGESLLLEGGHEYDGRPISVFDEDGMRAAARRFRETGVHAVAITSVFSPLTSELEERAAEIVLEEHPDAWVTLSHDIGRIALLERENATLLNACLQDLARKTTRAFTKAIEESDITAQLYLTQNDGTVMLAEVAGRVEEGRGGLYRIGITPFPFPAHQTGRANFPHPAFRLASSRGTRRGAKMNPAQPKHAEIPEHGPSREPRGAARRHLVTPDQKMPHALIDVIVDRSIGRQARPVAEVVRPAAQHAVQLVAHLGPGCLVAGPQEPSDLQLEPSHALPGRARPQIPVAILAKALRAEAIAQEVEALLAAIADAGLGLVQGQSQPGHHLPRPGQGLPRVSATEDDKVIGIVHHLGAEPCALPGDRQYLRKRFM